MDRRTKLETVVFLGLIAAGVSVRLLLRDWPNIAPVAAIALFSGYYFRSKWTALAVPFCMMAISDHFIGGHHWMVMVAVYAMLALPVAARGVLRRHFDLSSEKRGEKVKAVCGLLACSLTTSILFYVVTNFAVWFISPMMYPPPLEGLGICYVNALPFFRNSLASNLFFGVALFGGYALLLNLGRASQPQDATALESI